MKQYAAKVVQLYNKLRADKWRSTSSRPSLAAAKSKPNAKSKAPVKANDKAALYGYFSRLLTLAGILGIMFATVSLFEQPTIKPATTFSIPTVTATTENAESSDKPQGLSKSEPVRINVPAVGIDAEMMTVGKNDDGTMETPPLDQHLAGWYKFGPTPGELGPAIIVGHVDTFKGPAIFYRLKDLKPNDIIEVSRADGKLVKFEVTELQQFEQDNFPTEKVYGNLDYPGIRLITCGGSFNQQTQSYSHNTVVFGKMIES